MELGFHPFHISFRVGFFLFSYFWHDPVQRVAAICHLLVDTECMLGGGRGIKKTPTCQVFQPSTFDAVQGLQDDLKSACVGNKEDGLTPHRKWVWDRRRLMAL